MAKINRVMFSIDIDDERVDVIFVRPEKVNPLFLEEGVSMGEWLRGMVRAIKPGVHLDGIDPPKHTPVA